MKYFNEQIFSLTSGVRTAYIITSHTAVQFLFSLSHFQYVNFLEIRSSKGDEHQKLKEFIEFLSNPVDGTKQKTCYSLVLKYHVIPSCTRENATSKEKSSEHLKE